MLQRSEKQILKGIRAGEPDAFETVINENYKSIYSFLAYMSGDTSTAEDLTQDAFTSAWINIDSLQKQASIKTWLHKIAYNKFLDFSRKSQKKAALKTEFIEKVPVEQTGLDPLSIVTQDEFTQNLYTAMMKLESEEYTVIVLHYIQNFSYREMKNILNEPVGTIKWRTNKAIRKLKDILTGRV